MSKFKVGDKLRVIRCPEHWECDGRPDVGDIVEVSEADSTGVYIGFGGESCYANDGNFEPAEDRTNWHPHHDVIVAWAKGAKVKGTSPSGKTALVYPSGELSNPSFFPDWNWEIIEEPDHTAEIAEIERKMRELSESQKELADRLEKLK